MPDRIWANVVMREPQVRIDHKGDGYTLFEVEEARTLFRQLGDALARLGAFEQPRRGDYVLDRWAFEGTVAERAKGDLVTIRVETGDSLPIVGDHVKVEVTPHAR